MYIAHGIASVVLGDLEEEIFEASGKKDSKASVADVEELRLQALEQAEEATNVDGNEDLDIEFNRLKED